MALAGSVGAVNATTRLLILIKLRVCLPKASPKVKIHDYRPPLWPDGLTKPDKHSNARDAARKKASLQTEQQRCAKL